MKIAIICNYTLQPNRIGGMDRFYKLFDQKCKEKKYKIDWYFTDYKFFSFYKELSIISANGTPVEQKFIDFSINNNKRYDIIITHFTQLCTKYYKLFKKINPTSFIIAVDHNPRPLDGFSLKKRIKKRLEALLYSKYINQFVGVSKYTFNHILKDYGQFLKPKTTVIYNGIKTSLVKKKTKENQCKFIIASHLRKSKGIQDLLMALSLINQDLLRNCIVDIYGEGPFEKNLKALSNNLKLNKIVYFKGSSSNLHNLYAEYSYMIQPTYMECFSLSILESLSANVPVITTTVGGNLELLKDGENSFIFNPKDYKSLSLILTDIVLKKRQITTDVSLDIEKNFYLEKMVDQYQNLLPCI